MATTTTRNLYLIVDNGDGAGLTPAAHNAAKNCLSKGSGLGMAVARCAT